MGRSSRSDPAPPPPPPPVQAPPPSQYTKPTQQQYAQQQIAEDQWAIYQEKFRPVEEKFLKDFTEQDLEPYGITRSNAEVMQKTKLNPEAYISDDGRKHMGMSMTSNAIGSGLAAGNRQSIMDEETRKIQGQLNLLKMGSGQAVQNLQTATQGAQQSASAALTGLSSEAQAAYAMQDNNTNYINTKNKADADRKAQRYATMGSIAGFGLSLL